MARLPEAPLSVTSEGGVRSWRAQVPDLPYYVAVTIALGSDGRLICTELRVQADEVTARGIRRIPLGQIVDAVAILLSRLDKSIKPPPVARRRPVAVGWLEDEDFRRQLEERPPQPRRARITDELLKEVAAEYRRLTRAGNRTPVKTLAGRHKWSNGQIYGADNLRRLKRIAVDRLLLGPAIPGKAGEAKPRRARRKALLK